jgi:hypothetical protein
MLWLSPWLAPFWLARWPSVKQDQSNVALKEAFAKLQAFEAERLAVEALPSGDDDFEDRFSAHTGGWQKAAYAIRYMPAGTSEGVPMKARVLRSPISNHTGNPTVVDNCASPSQLSAWSLVGDLLQGKSTYECPVDRRGNYVASIPGELKCADSRVNRHLNRTRGRGRKCRVPIP